MDKRDLILKLLTGASLTDGDVSLLPEGPRDVDIWQQYFLAEGTAAVEQLCQAAFRRSWAHPSTTTKVLESPASSPVGALRLDEIGGRVQVRDDAGIATRIYPPVRKFVGPVDLDISDIRMSGVEYALVEIEAECGTVDNEYYVWGSMDEDWHSRPDDLERKRWCVLLRDGMPIGSFERGVSSLTIGIRDALLRTLEGECVPTRFSQRNLPADFDAFREAFIAGAVAASLHPSPRELCGSSKSDHQDGDVIASFSAAGAEMRFVARRGGRYVRLEGPAGFSMYVCQVGGFHHDYSNGDQRGTHHIRLLNTRECTGDTFLEGVVHWVNPDRTIAERLVIVLRHGRLIATFQGPEPSITIAPYAVPSGLE
jgi:hypothetical protein